MCGRGIGDNKHFLLDCHQFDLMRRDFFHLLTISGLDIKELDSNVLQFGSNDLKLVQNRTITEAIISFIKATKRLD